MKPIGPLKPWPCSMTTIERREGGGTYKVTQTIQLYATHPSQIITADGSIKIAVHCSREQK